MSNHYTYRAEWSPEDNEYVGLVAEFPSLSWLAPTAAEAITGAERLVDDILADMAETGETPPEPLTERRYSGNLSVRTSPEQHRQITIEAAEQGVSVNQWIIQKLGKDWSAIRSHVASGAEKVIANVVGQRSKPLPSFDMVVPQMPASILDSLDIGSFAPSFEQPKEATLLVMYNDPAGTHVVSLGELKSKAKK